MFCIFYEEKRNIIIAFLGDLRNITNRVLTLKLQRGGKMALPLNLNAKKS